MQLLVKQPSPPIGMWEEESLKRSNLGKPVLSMELNLFQCWQNS